MTKRSVILKLLSLLASAGMAEATASSLIIGEEPRAPTSLAPHAEFLVDPTAKLNLAQVSAAPWSHGFKPSTTNPPSFGFTDAAVWMRCEIRSASTRTESVIIALRSARIAQVAWHVVADGHVE